MYWQAFCLVFYLKIYILKAGRSKTFYWETSWKKIFWNYHFTLQRNHSKTSYLIAPLAIQITTSDHIREIEVCTAGCKLKEDQLNKTPSQQLEVTLKTDLLWWEGNCAGPKQFRPAKDQLVDVCWELFLTQIVEIWKLWFLAMRSLCSVLWSQYILFEHRTKLYFVQLHWQGLWCWICEVRPISETIRVSHKQNKRGNELRW